MCMQALIADKVRLKLNELGEGNQRFAVAPGLPWGLKYWPVPYILLKVKHIFSHLVHNGDKPFNCKQCNKTKDNWLGLCDIFFARTFTPIIILF